MSKITDRAIYKDIGKKQVLSNLYYRAHQILKLKCFLSRLAVRCAQSIDAKLSRNFDALEIERSWHADPKTSVADRNAVVVMSLKMKNTSY